MWSLLKIRGDSRAIAAEIVAGTRMVLTIPDSEFRSVELAQFKRTLLDRMYEPGLTVYSAAAHWYANQRGISDVVEAYRACDLLAWFCLDAPAFWIEGLAATSEFKKALGEESAKNMTISLGRRDRGALFFMLSMDSRIKTTSQFWSELNVVLQSEWGITLAALQKISHTEAKKVLKRLTNSPGPIRTLANIWKENHAQRGSAMPLNVFDERLKLPAVILADDTPLNIFSMRWGESAFDDRVFDPRPYFDELIKPYLALRKYGAYSEIGKHCYSIP